MKEPLIVSFPSRHFIVYSCIGVSGALLDYIVYFALISYFGWDYLLTNFLSTSLGISNNFALNVLINFKVRDRLIMRFVSFYAVGSLGLLMTLLLMWFLVSTLGFDPLFAKVLTIVCVVILQYGLNKAVTFKNFNTKDGRE